MFFDASGDGQDVGIKYDIVWIKLHFVYQDMIRSTTYLYLSIGFSCLKVRQFMVKYLHYLCNDPQCFHTYCPLLCNKKIAQPGTDLPSFIKRHNNSGATIFLDQGGFLDKIFLAIF